MSSMAHVIVPVVRLLTLVGHQHQIHRIQNTLRAISVALSDQLFSLNVTMPSRVLLCPANLLQFGRS